jgi:hypothetical protein
VALSWRCSYGGEGAAQKPRGGVERAVAVAAGRRGFVWIWGGGCLRAVAADGERGVKVDIWGERARVVELLFISGSI